MISRSSAMISILRRLALGISIVGASGSHAGAVPVLDQSNLYPTNINLGGIPVVTPASVAGFYLEAAQTFTVGVSGLLTTLQLQIGGRVAYAVTVDIRPLAGGAGSPPLTNTADALATFAVVSPAWPEDTFNYPVTSIDVSAAGLFVDIGDLLAITVRTNSAVYGGWASGPSPYAGGESYLRDSVSGSWNGNGGDAGFATYVDPNVGPQSAVPEPASLALLGMALIGMARLTRCRRPGLRRTAAAALLSVCGFGIAAENAVAAPLLDQSHLGDVMAGGGIGTGVSGSPIIAQTFTVGQSGVLDAIAIALADFGSLDSVLFSVRAVVGGVPSGVSLANISIPAAAIPDTNPATFSALDLVHLDVSSFGITVSPGDTLSFALSAPANYAGGWLGAPGYAGGMGLFYVGSGFEQFSSQLDLFFQTYVEVEQVPEPGLLGLTGAATLYLIGLARRRRARTRSTVC